MSGNGAEGLTGTNDDAGRNGTIVPAHNASNRRFLRSDELGEQLLPGLPNEITMDLITPRLPWKEIVSTMSSVCHAWQDVIRSHEVYDARVRSHSTEEFVLINQLLCEQDIVMRYGDHLIALYSPRERKTCYLPPIPHLRRGFPYCCRCVSLRGKVYILGGVDEFHMATKMGFDVASEKVYVLDLYGQRHWKECASMEYRRANFGCGILGGKIYVFGGRSFEQSFGESAFYGPVVDPWIPISFSESEMYDPDVDAWFPIKSLSCFRSHHEVATVGEELFVYGGKVYDEISEDRVDGPRLVSGDSEEALFLQIYNPAMDEWFGIDRFQRDKREQIVLARGNLISITQFDIHEYDMDENSWGLLHTCSFPTFGPEVVIIRPIGAVAVDDELLLRVRWYRPEGLGSRSCLLRSRGFGSENKTIVWENAEGSSSFTRQSSHRADFMSLAEL